MQSWRTLLSISNYFKMLPQCIILRESILPKHTIYTPCSHCYGSKLLPVGDTRRSTAETRLLSLDQFSQKYLRNEKHAKTPSVIGLKTDTPVRKLDERPRPPLTERYVFHNLRIGGCNNLCRVAGVA